MREILFRAWDKTVNRLFYNVQKAYDTIYLFTDREGNDCDYDNHYESSISSDCDFGAVLDNKDLIVEQYTGLKDKNGKEIYEGDIVEDKEAGYVNVVIFNKESASFTLDDWHIDWYDYDDRKNFEVIGNIHENKDLLN